MRGLRTRTQVAVAAAVALVLAVLVGLVVVARHLGVGVGLPDEALAAAVAGHARLGGSPDATVSNAEVFADCAVVMLQDPGPDGALEAVAVFEQDGVWRFGRSTLDEEAQFDTDDVLLDPAGCRRIATSTGPIVHGGPAE